MPLTVHIMTMLSTLCLYAWASENTMYNPHISSHVGRLLTGQVRGSSDWGGLEEVRRREGIRILCSIRLSSNCMHGQRRKCTCLLRNRRNCAVAWSVEYEESYGKHHTVPAQWRIQGRGNVFWWAVYEMSLWRETSHSIMWLCCLWQRQICAKKEEEMRYVEDKEDEE